jgi:hypothetical protein
MQRALRSGAWAVGIAALLVPLGLSAEPGSVLEVGKFSAEAEGNGPPAGWQPLTFKKIERQTVYKLVKDGESVVVRAVSEASSSGLTREIRIDPRDYPIIQWRWKVANVYKNGDVSKKEGKVGILEKATYEAARLLYGRYPPIGAINYIWESRAPKGTIVPNPYTDRVRMVVTESGAERLNTWVTEERNLLEDYKAAFGEEPSLISGVAIMTDTDNTKETATAYYGDILFKKAK